MNYKALDQALRNKPVTINGRTITKESAIKTLSNNMSFIEELAHRMNDDANAEGFMNLGVLKQLTKEVYDATLQ